MADTTLDLVHATHQSLAQVARTGREHFTDDDLQLLADTQRHLAQITMPGTRIRRRLDIEAAACAE